MEDRLPAITSCRMCKAGVQPSACLPDASGDLHYFFRA